MTSFLLLYCLSVLTQKTISCSRRLVSRVNDIPRKVNLQSAPRCLLFCSIPITPNFFCSSQSESPIRTSLCPLSVLRYSLADSWPACQNLLAREESGRIWSVERVTFCSEGRSYFVFWSQDRHSQHRDVETKTQNWLRSDHLLGSNDTFVVLHTCSIVQDDLNGTFLEPRKRNLVRTMWCPIRYLLCKDGADGRARRRRCVD